MLILIRLSGEISTKAKGTRARFTKRLVNNIQAALERHSIEHSIKREWSRLFVKTEDEGAIEVLQRVFGIRSISVAEHHVLPSLEEIVDEGGKFFEAKVADKRFAVRARRIGNKKPPFKSGDVEVALGSRLYESGQSVDLTTPEVTAYVEINNTDVYFFSDSIVCAGGLPLGAKGRGLALISGGFDSAVAAWMILKRGICLDYVFLNLGGAAHLSSMMRVTKVLTDNWSYGDQPKLFAIDFERVMDEMRGTSDSRYWQILLKRHMMRAAESVAGQVGSLVLVTGEVIAQVSSQTLPNLHVISQATELPILRPLISFDKHEIIEMAKRIGTDLSSAEVEEYCALDVKFPVTDADPRRVEREESGFKFEVLQQAVDEMAIFDLNSIDVSAMSIREIETEEIPDGALVIDLRNEATYTHWHYPGAIYIDFFQAMAAPEEIVPPGTEHVVLYCEVGVKSAQIAEKLRSLGQNAFHFRGGMRNLLAYAIDHDLIPVELLPPSAFTD